MNSDWVIWLVIISSACAIGAVGALIAEYKNQSVVAGFLFGALLGGIGLAIVATIRRDLPKAPPGMWALACPRCNAVQNINEDDEHFACWQCSYTEAVDEMLAR